jgi:septal ring factor EnvC (AmiA/AmiB activator)
MYASITADSLEKLKKKINELQDDDGATAHEISVLQRRRKEIANNISALEKQVAAEKENYNEAMMCMQDAGNLLALGPSSQLYAHITAMNQPSLRSLAIENKGVPGNFIEISA